MSHKTSTAPVLFELPARTLAQGGNRTTLIISLPCSVVLGNTGAHVHVAYTLTCGTHLKLLEGKKEPKTINQPQSPPNSSLTKTSSFHGEAEPIPAVMRQNVGYTLDRSPVCHRASTETNHSHLVTKLQACLWTMGGSWSTVPGENPSKHRENSTPKTPPRNAPAGLDSVWEATVLSLAHHAAHCNCSETKIYAWLYCLVFVCVCGPTSWVLNGLTRCFAPSLYPTNGVKLWSVVLFGCCSFSARFCFLSSYLPTNPSNSLWKNFRISPLSLRVLCFCENISGPLSWLLKREISAGKNAHRHTCSHNISMNT